MRRYHPLMTAQLQDPFVIICPGQGAQSVSMGRAWFDASHEAKAVFQRADALIGDRLGPSLSDLCFHGPADRLNRTDISQPAIFVASIASWRGMLARLGTTEADAQLQATAGLSLGEYTALHVAGAISFEDALELVTLRGRAMQDAAEAPSVTSGGGGGMVALVGADEAQAQAVCDSARGPDVLVCANFNAPGQVVLSGHKSACERAAAVAGDMGLKSAILPVAGAFHSSLMAPAAKRLEAALAKTSFKAPRCPVYSNVTAQPHAPTADASLADSIRRSLVEQLTSPVRWSQSCAAMAKACPGSYQELAPGKVLAGLMRRIDKSVKVISNDIPA